MRETSDPRHLTQMVYNLSIQIQTIADKEGAKQTGQASSSIIFYCSLPVCTYERMCEFDTQVATDPNFATQVKGILSVVGGNKNLKTIIRGVMGHLMSKELRMGYVTRKPTSGKKIFATHKNLSKLVLGKSITFYLTLKNSVL